MAQKCIISENVRTDKTLILWIFEAHSYYTKGSQLLGKWWLSFFSPHGKDSKLTAAAFCIKFALHPRCLYGFPPDAPFSSQRHAG